MWPFFLAFKMAGILHTHYVKIPVLLGLRGFIRMKHTVSLKENYMFRRLYNRGKSVVDPYIAVYYKKNHMENNRLGITATKKIGCAVERNRARRVIKEAYRLSEDELPRGMDFVIVARKKAVYAKTQNIRHSLRKMFLQRQPPTQRNNG